ncbi:MAG TPA: TetR family transcriptional regulator [Kofleriaceae bacterium]|jgi:AcrR family transcriptional regulator
MTRQPKTRQQTKAETRLALIDAGVAEFGRHGFDVSLDQICARAKLTRGAFYVHFADREAFIVAVMHHVMGGFVNVLTGPLDAKLAIRLFIAAIRARAPVVSGGSGLRFHHVLEACRRSKAIAAAYREVVAKARVALVASVPDGVADMLIAIALGMLAANEIEIPMQLDHLEKAMLALV